MDRASSQSFTEQHRRLAQQHNQAAADGAASRGNANGVIGADGGARPMRNTALNTLMSVREEDPSDTVESPPAQPQGPTGTLAAVSPAPAGLQRTSGSSQGSARRPPRPVHYGMTEQAVPLPVLHSPFASLSKDPLVDAAPVLSSVDDNLQALQDKL